LRDVHAEVAAYYGRVLRSSADLKTSACCVAEAPPAHLREALARIHPEVSARFYGCGYPIPEALSGATVLDLGCGSGRDVYLLSQLVGPHGFVHGVDMTAEQLAVAEGALDWHTKEFGYERPNVAFHRGFIEDLSAIADASVDVVVSNCVVNLSPRKDLVLAEVARVLRRGGELRISDVVADRRLADVLREDPLLHAECLGGALYEHDFLDLARAKGFLDPRTLARSEIRVTDAELARRVGAARFFSLTLRLFALPGLEPRCEDYGQLATYRGGLPGCEDLFTLDDHHAFERGRPERVCGNTAAMLAETRFAPFFAVAGDRRTHYGPFPCGDTIARQGRAPSAASGSACC
jgi:SAM-dependent methyltransferase